MPSSRVPLLISLSFCFPSCESEVSSGMTTPFRVAHTARTSTVSRARAVRRTTTRPRSTDGRPVSMLRTMSFLKTDYIRSQGCKYRENSYSKIIELFSSEPALINQPSIIVAHIHTCTAHQCPETNARSRFIPQVNISSNLSPKICSISLIHFRTSRSTVSSSSSISSLMYGSISGSRASHSSPRRSVSACSAFSAANRV